MSASRPVLIGIDGQSGSGKSTLAEQIQGSLEDVSIVHKDDFYSCAPEEQLAALTPPEGYERYFEWQRLREQVLLPLSSGVNASYQRFDWARKVPGEWRSVSALSRVVIVEGVYALRPDLRVFYDLKARVNTSGDVRASRLIAREENSQAWISRWSAAEDYYFCHIFSEGDVFVINGGSPS